MVRMSVFSVALVAIVCGGCVSKSEHQALQTQLEECQQQADEYEGLYREAMDDRKAALEEAIDFFPAAAAELRQEVDLRLDEATKGMDADVRQQVTESLDRLTGAMAEGYRTLSEQNTKLDGQLTESRRLLEGLMERTGSIERTVGSDRVAILRKREAVFAAIDGLITDLRDWKYRHVDCAGCEEHLRLNKKERDAIAQLQIDTLSSLEGVRNEFVLLAADLQTMVGESAEDAGAGPSEAAEQPTGDL